MPRAAAPDTLLITFSEAARLLSVSSERLRGLIAKGHLRPHPVLDDRILRSQIDRFATNYEHAPEDRQPTTDAESGRTVDAPTPPNGYGIPPLRLRSHV